jgi:hypothetical protein
MLAVSRAVEHIGDQGRHARFLVPAAGGHGGSLMRTPTIGFSGSFEWRFADRRWRRPAPFRFAGDGAQIDQRRDGWCGC